MNNITPLVQEALEKFRDLYNNPRSKAFVIHLLKAFGNNSGVPARNTVFKPCPITGKKQINTNNVRKIEEPILKNKVTNFLLNTLPTKDRFVLDFTSQFGWTADDTTYTVGMFLSLDSELPLSRQAYIALQRFEKELQEDKRAFEGKATEAIGTELFQNASVINLKKSKKK